MKRFNLLGIIILSICVPLVISYDPFSTHARIRVEDGNLVFEAPPRKSISFKSTLGTIYVNGDKLDNLITKSSSSSSSSTSLQTISSDASLDQRIVSLKETVDKLNEYSDVLNKARALFNPGRRQFSPRDFRRSLINVTRLTSEFNQLKQRLEENLCSSNPCRNGGTCISSFQSYTCQCREGWEGVNCDLDVNECLKFASTDLGCQNGATCINLPGTYQCNCLTGFYGVHCTQRSDDCASASNEALCGHGICLSTGKPIAGKPHYTCLCDQGWTTDGVSPACRIDVDECASPMPHCSINPPVECINYPGGFTCGPCPPGYNKQGFYCVDVDECQNNNGGCSISPRVQCRNIPGGRECGPCPPGYAGDGITCSYAGVCSIRNGDCSPVAQCTESTASIGSGRECRCPVGYIGNGEGPNGCLPTTSTTCDQNPCVAGVCIPGNSNPPSFTCQCQPGFTGRRCDTQIASGCDPNPCLNGGLCINDPSGPICRCTPAYQGDRCQDQRSACVGDYDSPTGTISYPSDEGSSNYPSNTVCNWRIRTSLGNVIQMTFTKLDVEPSFSCHADSVSFYDGLTSTAPLIGKYCGRLDSLPENHTVTSEQPYVLVTFTSDVNNQGSGFSLNWTTVKPECGGIINGSEFGAIYSPGYPEKYPPGRDCYWYIYGSLGKRIVFHFALLSLESHSNCSFDFLRIYDGSSDTDPILGNYCNTTSPAPITTSGPFALVHFHSDRNRQDSGFHMTFATIPAISGCGGLLTGDRGALGSPSFPNRYEGNLECDWLIRIRSPDDRIELRFDSFDLEHHPNCRYDYVEIRDGDQPLSPLIGRYCSYTIKPPVPILSKSNKLFIRFRSDWSREGTGFHATYEVFCGGYYTSNTGVITSPNYPLSYPSSKNCTYHIRVSPGSVIQLSFSFFQLEDSPECRYDYVAISEPGINSTNLTSQMCGSQLPDTITSNLNEMTITFKTDAHSNGRGFRANYSTIDASCGGVLRDKNGIITSPSHPDDYSHNKECVWILSAPKGHVVQLTFTMFALEGGRRCSYDYVEVMERNNNFGRFCGNQIPPPIQSSDDQLIVRFKSDLTVAFEGFVGAYSFLNGSKFCGGVRRGSSGEITSPNYPQKYPKSRRCIWQIIGPENNQIQLQFTDMDTENHEKCSFDYIEVYNGIGTTAPLVGRYCGKNLPPSIISHTNSLTVLFVTDSGISGNGFRLTYNIAATGCGGTLRSANGIITSPNYPYSYYHNAECTWVIKTSKGSRLILNIVDIDFEAHQDCALDRLDIYDGPNDKAKRLAKACGDKLISEPVKSTSDTVTVKMVTDGSLSFRGFKLNYATDCFNKISGYRGAIETPNYPNLFSPNSNCSWEIATSRGSNISLAFQEVNVKSPCSTSYLLINQTKYCLNNSLGNIQILDNSVKIDFININSTIPSSFRLEWSMIGCGGDLIDDSGRITSPNYPNPYPHAVTCQWTIKAKPGYQVFLTVFEYYIEAATNCQYDSLQIFAGPDTTSPRQLKLCGRSYSTKSVSSVGNYMTILFTTDLVITSKGFRMEYYTKPGLCGGYQNLEEGTVFSPNYPGPYDASSDCEWVIGSTAHRIKITIQDLDIPASANCSDSYLAFSFNDGNELSRLCGNVVPTEQIISPNDIIRVRFKADGEKTAKGFQFLYQAICGGERVAEVYTRSLTSPNYPSISLKNPSCDWIIKTDEPGKRIFWTFSSIIIGTASSLELREGDSNDSPLIVKYTTTVHPLPTITQGNALFVRQTGNVIFSAYYTSDISRCGGTFSSFTGYFSSPGYPNSYPLSTTCIWTIRVSPGNRVTLTFSDFNFESDDFCALDYLEIREGNSAGRLIGRFCGQSMPSLTNSSFYEGLWIKFQSDGEGSAPGFQASFDTATNVELTGKSGYIASPSYPSYFSTDAVQTWTITVEDGLTIALRFISIAIPLTYQDCRRYHIIIYDGADKTYPVLGKFCGFQVNDIITSSTNTIHIYFEPNIYLSRFKLMWKAEAKNVSSPVIDLTPRSSTCDTTLNLELDQNITITSPGYPYGYSPNLNCSWIISSPMGTHLSVRVNDLNIEYAIVDTCNYDRLVFYDYDFEDNVWQLNRTICGKSKDSLELNSDLSQIVFTTDSHINKTGFNLTLTPACGGIFHNRQGFINSSILKSAESCTWKILVREGRTIGLKFDSFNLGSGNPCSQGYMNIRDGPFENSPLIGHLCGSNLPSDIQSDSNQLYISVYAPKKSRSDFTITYEEISAACGGTIDLDENNPSMTIQSPGYPSLPPHSLECDWLIKGPAHRNLRLDFEITSNPISPCDVKLTHLDIHDGGTELSTRLGRFCPRPRSSGVTTSENLMFVRYYASGDLTLAPFKATVSINICGGSYFVSSTVIIQSPNYPKLYDNNINCGYYIHASRAQSIIKATIVSLDLPSGSTGDCNSGDYLEFRDSGPTGDLIEKVCGTRNSTFTLQSATKIMYLLFKSDAENAGQGFKISFNDYIDFEKTNCYALLNASKPGTIKTPQSSHGYPLTCFWKLIAPIDRRVTVTFTKYNLKPDSRSANSCLDSLEVTFDYQPIYEIDKVFTESNKMNLPCEYRTQFSITSPTNLILLKFKATSLGPGEGIEADYFASEPTVCGGIITKSSPSLITTNFTNPIDNSVINCVWRIDNDVSQSADSTKWIEYETIEVLGSDYSEEYCSNGRITEGQFRGSFNIINKIICGNKTNVISIAPSAVSSIGVTARINRTRGYRGFKGTYHVSDCGGRITYSEGNFSSPGWPQGYTVNTVCLWEFVGQYGSVWQVNFTDFELEEDCTKDSLEIREGSIYDSALVGRFCANNKPTPFTSLGRNVIIIFKSDGTGSAKGFNLKFSRTKKNCGGSTKSGTISSGGYPATYSKNSECIWNIEVEQGYRVNLTFADRFDIEESVNCSKDYIKINQWSDNAWKFVGKYCGLTAPKPILLDSNKGQVIFHSDDDNRRGDGFRLLIIKQCGFDVDKPGSGIIRSPGFPFYHTSAYCAWTLKGQQPSDIIKIDFQVFDLEKDPSCSYDYVKMIKGASSNRSEGLGQYCGSTKPENIVTRGDLKIIFKSDSINARRGFDLIYQIIPCGGNFTQPSGKITSPNIDGNYVNNAHCSYLITVPEDFAVMLRFNSLQLYITDLCDSETYVYNHANLDYLEIRDGSDPNSYLLRRLCGVTEQMVFKSSSNSMLLIFHSDEEFTSSGFEATWEATIGPKQGCGGILNATSGTIESPDINNDGRYENNLDCSWVIISDGENDALELTFSLMDIEASSLSPKIECSNDFLEIRDGLSPSSQLIDVFCSSELPTKLRTSASRAYLHFYSNEEKNGAGFRLSYKTINNTCGFTATITNVTASGVITSPNYPNSYPAIARCRWQLSLQVYGSELSIKFTDLDLDCGDGASLELTGNSLYSETQLICGKTAPPTYHIYNEATFIFTSRSNQSALSRGFSLTYKLAGCNDTYSESSGVIASEFYPQPYHTNGACNFSIIAPPGSFISVYFHEAEFTFHGMANCNKTASFSVKDGDNPVQSVNICNGRLPDPIFSTNSTLSFSVQGFWYKYYLLYTTTDLDPGCGGDIRAFNGSFTSPGYPNYHKKQSVCTWNIFSYGYNSLTIRFVDFIIVPWDNCANNYVELSDGAFVARYCGLEIPAAYNSRGNTLTIKMVTSNNAPLGNRFRAEFAINQLAIPNLQRVLSNQMGKIGEKITDPTIHMDGIDPYHGVAIG